MPQPSLRTLAKSPPEGFKVCGHCCAQLPADTDNFDIDNSKPDGFRNWCKQCRKEKKEMQRLKNAANVIEAIDKELLKGLTQSKNGGSNVPHMAQLCEAMVQILGGHQGVAQHWAANLLAAKPGSQTRERMLSGLIKMVAALSDSNKVSMPAELMSDDDLNNAIAEREARLRVVTLNPEESLDAESA